MIICARLLVMLAGLIHIYIFLMESIWWGKPRVNRVFGVSTAQAEQNRLLAFNQGFYNLFLAIAALAGVVLAGMDYRLVGETLMSYSSLSMVAAAGVLLYSQSKLIRAAMIQGLPPLIGLLFLFFSS